ncbi:unnamed protein product [Linum trigynum]|uniref:Uncharacterized protein n=1 Tax=Linum trigynum TaxID=586398 RepID=A0AAV2GS47_9ROSI
MKTQLENMGLDYQAPVFPGKAPSRQRKKGASKKGGSAKSSSTSAKARGAADAPVVSAGKGKGRSSPRRIKPQQVPSARRKSGRRMMSTKRMRCLSLFSPTPNWMLTTFLLLRNSRGRLMMMPRRAERSSAQARRKGSQSLWKNGSNHPGIRLISPVLTDPHWSGVSALGFAFHAAEVLRAPSDVQGKNLWGEVARMAAMFLFLNRCFLLAKNGAMAHEEQRMGEVEASSSLGVVRDDLETAQRRQAELVQACDDATLEAAKAASLLQQTMDEEKKKLKLEHEAELETVKRAHHEEMAKLMKERADLDKEAGAQRSEIDLLIEEKKTLQKEKKILARENKRRQEELEALKGKATSEAPVSDMALKAQASLNSILILKRKLEADHPTINWDVKEMANFVIDFMSSGRPVVDPAPAPPQNPVDEGEDSGSGSESDEESAGEEEG